MTDTIVMDARIARRLRQSYWSRLKSDSLLVLVGHAVGVSLVGLSLRGVAAPAKLIPWMLITYATTVLRAVWQHRAGSAAVTDRRLLQATRAIITLHALSWGVGTALLMGTIPATHDAIILAVLASIVGGGVNMLSADAPSFYLLLGGMALPLPFGLFAGENEPVVEMAVLVFGFCAVMILVHRRVRAAMIEHLRTVVQLTTSEETQARLIAELRAALANVKTLTGLLPICSRCKKVRDDMGYWGSVERYIAEHTDARFSHGVCPDCFPKLFPGIEMPKEEAAAR